VEKYGTARQANDENIIQRMRIAGCIPKATNTHSEHVMLFAFPQQQSLCERASNVTLYLLLRLSLLRDVSLYKYTTTFDDFKTSDGFNNLARLSR
jgi:hypothetical protein